MKIRIRQGTYVNAVILLYGIIETLKYFTLIPVLLANGLGVVLGGCTFVYMSIKHGIKRQYRVIMFVTLYTLTGFMSYMYNGNIDLIELVWPVFFMGIAIALLNENVNYKIAAIPIYFFMIIMVYYLVRYGTIANGNYTSESRNYASIYSLSFFSIYMIAREQHNKKEIPWLTLLVVLLGSILANGRGGILVFGVMLFLMSVYGLVRTRLFVSTKKICMLLFGCIALIVLSFGMLDYGNSFIKAMHTSVLMFKNKGFSSAGRIELIFDYAKQIFASLLNFILAPPISGTTMLDGFSWNLHNSFLMLYARYGLVMFVVILMLFIKIIKKRILQRKWIGLIVIVAIMLRMLTDVCSFNGVLDIPIYYYIFESYYRRKNYCEAK